MVKVRVSALTDTDKGVKTPVYVADVLTISKIEDDWLWVGKGRINKSDVILKDEAEAYFTEQIKQEPNGFNYFSRAFVYEQAGELDKAIADESEAIRLEAGQQARLAVLYSNRGTWWYKKGEYDRAIDDYNEAIYNDRESARADDYRESADTHDNLGLAWYKNKQYDKAISSFDEAIRLNPDYEPSYHHRADINFLRGKYDKGLADLERALQIDPHDSYAYSEHAWLCATCPDAKFRDGAKAVELATKACELNSWQYADYVNTLAAAYAEKGEFDLAVKWQTRALELKLGPGTTWTPEDLRDHLELYKSGKPYRDDSKLE